jgi:hypothetical protein
MQQELSGGTGKILPAICRSKMARRYRTNHCCAVIPEAANPTSCVLKSLNDFLLEYKDPPADVLGSGKSD